MMLYPPMSELVSKVGSRYLLVNLVARRARDISQKAEEEGESLDSALKRFKRSCAKAGVIAEVRRREHYESPSVKRRKKSEAARKNRNKRFY